LKYAKLHLYPHATDQMPVIKETKKGYAHRAPVRIVAAEHGHYFTPPRAHPSGILSWVRRLIEDSVLRKGSAQFFTFCPFLGERANGVPTGKLAWFEKGNRIEP